MLGLLLRVYGMPTGNLFTKAVTMFVLIALDLVILLSRGTLTHMGSSARGALSNLQEILVCFMGPQLNFPGQQGKMLSRRKESLSP